MKIFGKKIGKFLSVIWNGKPKQIETKSKEEMEEYVGLINKSNQGDEDALEELKEKIFVEPEIKTKEIKKIEKQIDETENQILEVSTEFENVKKYEEFKRQSEIFEIKTIEDKDVSREAVYLKGFKSELPPFIVDKFYELMSTGKDITPLVNFWQLNLLNKNAEARRGLYNFILKQRLILTKQGYFVAFRRIVKVSEKTKSNVNISKEFIKSIDEFASKIKRWKKSPRSFEVYLNKGQDGYFLRPIKDHEKNKFLGTFQGTLFDCIEKIKLSQNDQQNETQQVFTDAHTRTMVIKIGEPVKMSRSKCNSNARVECSYGLHVGSQDYVYAASSLGDTLVAVLVNPMHVISVPYSDAHKMRVCEYFPFVIIENRDDMKNFEQKFDIDQYTESYKKIEANRLKNSINVEDQLSLSEFKKFDINKKITTQEELDKLISSLNEKKEKLSKEKKNMSVLLDDDISESLDYEEVRKIIENRLK